jgi:hypothetical protein
MVSKLKEKISRTTEESSSRIEYVYAKKQNILIRNSAEGKIIYNVGLSEMDGDERKGATAARLGFYTRSAFLC